MLRFGFVAKWQASRSSAIYREIHLHRDTSLLKEVFFVPQCIAVDSSPYLECVPTLLGGKKL
jgi:hypothetical protein